MKSKLDPSPRQTLVDCGSWVLLTVQSLRGISHIDAVDIKKKPFKIKGGTGVTDICDVYVHIARELK